VEDTRENRREIEVSMGNALNAGSSPKTPVGSDGLICASPQMSDLLERTRLIAGRPAPIVVSGESGTGKTRICQVIHEASDYRRGQFFKKGCGEFDEGTLEATLFGSTRDAYTSAQIDRIGVLKAADGGTLVLDDVDCLTLSAQSRLLRFLDDGKFHRLGEPARASSVDVRIIATTNKDLDQLVREHRFRQDLLNRLRRWRLHIPPLRERPEDIVALASHFLTQSCATKAGEPSPLFDAQALELLALLPWPSNVRGLRDAVENVALSHQPQNGIYTLSNVADALFDPKYGPCLEDLRTGTTADQPQRIQRLLALTRHNVSLTARILGCSRTTVYKAERGIAR
jgi:DNA-binding NtrC family response regulator